MVPFLLTNGMLLDANELAVFYCAGIQYPLPGKGFGDTDVRGRDGQVCSNLEKLSHEYHVWKRRPPMGSRGERTAVGRLMILI